MKKKVRHIEEHRKAFEIEVAQSEVKRRKDELFEAFARTAAIPGFRPGRAPRDLLERHHGERVTREAIEDLISSFYKKALEEEGFIPLGLPQISEVRLDGAGELFFKAEFDIRPKVELKEYKGLKLNKKKIEVKEEDVQRSIGTLQESNARFKNVEGRPAQIGDYVVCDSEILIEGRPALKKRENIWMPIEEKSYIPDLSKRLAGALVDEEREIEAVLPEDFPTREYANKRCVFKIKIKEIKEKVLSQIDDEFAKDLGYNNLAELDKSVRQVLEQEAKRRLQQDLERQAIERLLENSNFTVPTSLVEEQLKYLVEEEKARLRKQGLKEEALKTSEKEIIARLRPVATRQVKVMFILDEIAHKEKITVSGQELDEVLGQIAKHHSQSRGKTEGYYRENDLMPNLRADIRNAKIIDLLIKAAEIEEGV